MTERATMSWPGTVAGPRPPSARDGGAELLAWLATMRRTSPVWRDGFGMYHVFRYDDVQRVLTEYATFSSDRGRLMPGNEQFGKGGLTMLDPPAHRHQRRLVGQAFSARTVTAMAPRIAAIMAGLLDRIEGDRFDFMAEIAYPLPVTVIAELLGVPASDQGLFRRWADGLMSMQIDDFSSPDVARTVAAAMAEMNGYLREHCRERRTRPRDDVLTRLVQADVDGDRLSDEEVVNSASLLLLAGHVTSTVMLGNAVLCLDAAPATAAAVRADRTLIPAALEEILRIRSPFAQGGRVTTTDTEVAGEKIPANRFVMAWLLSANHDETVFPDPERFDVDRPPNRQAAFGHGPHFCVGAPLARLEGRIALEALFDRFAALRPDPDQPPSFYDSAIFGPSRLPVVVQRR